MQRNDIPPLKFALWNLVRVSLEISAVGLLENFGERLDLRCCLRLERQIAEPSQTLPTLPFTKQSQRHLKITLGRCIKLSCWKTLEVGLVIQLKPTLSW